MKLTLYTTTVAIVALLLAGCGKKEVVVEKEVEKEILNFPYDLELVDRKGRTIAVTLVGRSGGESKAINSPLIDRI